MRTLMLWLLLSGCEGELFTDEEWSRLESLVNIDEDPPPDPVNKHVGDPEAEALGQMFFFDSRFSGVATGIDVLQRPTTASRAPIGERTGIMCATCHDPSRGGVDKSSVPGHVSIGAGIYDVNAESVINAAYYDLKYWNGRYDSLVWQAMAVTESPVSMNSDRVRVAWMIADYYRDRYEAIFEHPLPDFPRTFEEQAALLEEDGQCRLEAGVCPAECGGADGCWPRFPLSGRPGLQPFERMAQGDKDAVTRTFVNYAKAIAAYEYRLISRSSPFDRFVAEGGGSELISPAAQRGAKLFAGKASCIDCHRTPLFSDSKFHNVGVPQAGPGVPTEADCPAGNTCDCAAGTLCLPWGAYFGIGVLKRTTLRADNATFSDDPQLPERLSKWYERELTDDLKGAWRTPSLRDVALTAPYMHDGYYRSLDEVVRHYVQGGTRLGSASDQVDPRIRPLDLDEGEIQDLIEFLKTLTGEPLPMELVTAPALP
jgi:cytochrome c peroxidase